MLNSIISCVEQAQAQALIAKLKRRCTTKMPIVFAELPFMVTDGEQIEIAFGME